MQASFTCTPSKHGQNTCWGLAPHLGAGAAALHNPSALRLHAVSREGNACSRGLLLHSMERHETGEGEGLWLGHWP